jgi:hypothetical protein
MSGLFGRILVILRLPDLRRGFESLSCESVPVPAGWIMCFILNSVVVELSASWSAGNITPATVRFRERAYEVL